MIHCGKTRDLIHIHISQFPEDQEVLSLGQMPQNHCIYDPFWQNTRPHSHISLQNQISQFCEGAQFRPNAVKRLHQ